MSVQLKRIYEPPGKSDGARVLVERLWPRGVSKQNAKLALWARELAPSTELRKWFDHEPARWDEFKGRYFAELDARREALEPLLALTSAGPVTFVFASREEKLNNAVALREYIEALS